MPAWRRLLLLACFLISALFAFSQNSLLHGIDLGDLDRTAQPCDDFYQFANGTWRAKDPIPASMARWSRRW
jgi:putative endopeptidase